MRGVGRATAAITVVNALSTGIGAAIGIGIETEAEVELVPTLKGPPVLSMTGDGEATPLVTETVLSTIRALDPGTGYSISMGLRSKVPQGKGLKSSSAVSCAVALATARALGREPLPAEVARLSARASIKVGVSATGAFDDALASLVQGMVVTDNSKMTVLRHHALDRDWRVALYIPAEQHPPSPEYLGRFQKERSRGQGAVEAALHGELPLAMERNSELVEEILGYRYAGLRASVREGGAVAQGVSGMGPALAVITPSAAMDTVLSKLPQDRGERISTNFSAGILDLGDERI